MNRLDAVLRRERRSADEVWCVSAIHTFRGKCDRIEWKEGALAIIDYKTGRFDDHAKLQLNLYALAVLERLDQLGLALPKVELRVDAKDGVIKLEPDATTKSRWASISAAVLTGDARPGAICVRCSRRHACAAFRSAFEGSFDSPEDSFRELRQTDVWGVVREVRQASEGSVSLDIVRAGAGLVSVTRLRPGWLVRPDGAKLQTGARVSFYGLRVVKPAGRAVLGTRETRNFAECSPKLETAKDRDSLAWAVGGFVRTN